MVLPGHCLGNIEIAGSNLAQGFFLSCLQKVDNPTVFGMDLTIFGKVPENPPGANLSPFATIRKPWPGFGPGTFALPRQRSTRLSYQGADTKRI